MNKQYLSIIIKNKNVHHCFLYGGVEKFNAIEGIDSIITWGDIHGTYSGIIDATDYCLTVLARGIENYRTEFDQKSADRYYVEQGDIIDVIGKSYAEGRTVYIGLGQEKNALATLTALVESPKEELDILRKNNEQGFIKPEKRPAFLADPRYANQSAIEFLFKYNRVPYKIDYEDDRGSGEPKSGNPSWINGNNMIHLLKKLTKD